MRVLVCGSRTFTDYQLLEKVLDEYEISNVIQGEARGADSLARQYAERHGMAVSSFPADWAEHGKAAGAIRNVEMFTRGKPDFVVAFWDGKSRGTENAIGLAERFEIPIRVVEFKEAELSNKGV